MLAVRLQQQIHDARELLAEEDLACNAAIREEFTARLDVLRAMIASAEQFIAANHEASARLLGTSERVSELVEEARRKIPEGRAALQRLGGGADA